MSSTGSLFELLNRIGIRSVGRRPKWRLQEDTTGAPTSASSGVNITDAVKTLIHVSLREEVDKKTARIAVTYDDNTVYRVSVDENDVDVDTDSGAIADLDDLLQEIVDAINADVTAGDIVTAAVEDEEIVLRGDGEDAYDLAVSIVSGGGTIEITHEDADSASVRVYLRAGGTGDVPGAWVFGRRLLFEDLDYRGLVERISTAGSSRAYVEVYDVEPEGAAVTVSVGPGAQE